MKVKSTLFVAVFLSCSIMMGFIGGPSGGYKIGDRAADFKLKNVDGHFVSLSDFPKAKGFIVVFTCNHCPYAKKYEQRIMDLNAEFAAKGYPVIAISPNDPASIPADSYDNMVALAKQKHYSFPYLFDGDNATLAYGATSTPHVYVLRKENGGLIVRYIGAIDDNAFDPSAVKKRYAEDAVKALLGGGEPPVAFTKAIGCSIVRKTS